VLAARLWWNPNFLTDPIIAEFIVNQPRNSSVVYQRADVALFPLPVV